MQESGAAADAAPPAADAASGAAPPARAASEPAPIDLASVRDVDELIAMGTPRLKAALKARGMRCGGGAGLLAERLWWRCKQTLFADDSRSRIARQKSLRPVGAYSTVQPTNLAAEKEKFLAAAADFEAGRRRSPPDDPVFEYAESDRCEAACPAVPCTCSRFKLWQDYGPADDTYLADALRIIQNSRQAAQSVPEAAELTGPPPPQADASQESCGTSSSGHPLSAANAMHARCESAEGCRAQQDGKGTELHEPAGGPSDQEGEKNSGGRELLPVGLATRAPAVAAALAAAASAVAAVPPPPPAAAAAAAAPAPHDASASGARTDVATSHGHAAATRACLGSPTVGTGAHQGAEEAARSGVPESGAARLEKYLDKKTVAAAAAGGGLDLGENERCIETAVRKYLADLDMADLIDIRWMDPKVCGSASMVTCAEPGGLLRGALMCQLDEERMCAVLVTHPCLPPPLSLPLLCSPSPGVGCRLRR